MKTALRKALPLLLCLILCICLSPAAGAEELSVTDAAVFDASGISINTVTFPDYNFRNYVLNRLDLDRSTTLSENEISRVGSLGLGNMSISDLKGIEYFTNLHQLYCQQNALKSLDVRALRNLEVLYAWGNQLEALDVSQNPYLTVLALSMNSIEELDVSNNPYLQYLFVNNNKLREIDISALPYLVDFNCSSNYLTELNVSGNSALVFLSCEGNQLSSLNLNHQYLGRLYCAFNPLSELNISQCPELLEVVRNGSRTEAVTSAGYRHITYTGSKTETTEDGEYPYCVHYSADTVLSTQPNVTVTYNANGGYGSMNPQTVTSGQALMLSPNTFSRANYAFSHWNTKPDGSGISYANEGTVFPTASMTLYAQWVKNYYSVNYNSNGGGGVMGLNTVFKGLSTTVRENEFNAPSYSKVFSEWNTSPDGTGISYQPGDPIWSDDIPSDITLYAIWVDKLTIYYYPGSGSGVSQIQEVPRGTPVNLSAFNSLGFTAPENMTFAYWTDNYGSRYFNGQEIYPTTDLRLTAVYGETINITYNANGGTLKSGSQTGISLRTKAAKNVDYRLYTQEYLSLTRSGYEFLGWALGPSAALPKAGWEVYSEPIVVPEGFSQDTTIYAVWNQLGFEGTVTISGSLTDMASDGLVGETLTADVTNETKFFDYEYQWLRDGMPINGAFMQTYIVTAEDYGRTITCRVSAYGADPSTKYSVNYKEIRIGAAYKEIDIVNNAPEDEDDYFYGLTENMSYTFNSTNPRDRKPVSNPSSNLVIVNGVLAFRFTQQGTYRFYDVIDKTDLTKGSLIATVEVRNWYTLDYEITNISDHGSVGSGTVQMKNGSTVLYMSSNIKDSSGNTIIKGNGANTWLVREGASTDLKITVRPGSNSYAFVYLSGAELFRTGTEQTVSLGSLTGPEHYDIVFLQINNMPKFDIALTLPASLTELEEEAFAGGAFSYVVVPAQVTKIGSRAFADCRNLQYIEILGMNVEIAPDAFEHVSKLTIFYPYGSNVSDYTAQPGTSITFTPIYR